MRNHISRWVSSLGIVVILSWPSVAQALHCCSRISHLWW